MMGLQAWRNYRAVSIYPPVGEIFELTTTEEITPLGLIADFGGDPSKWRTKAKPIPANTTRYFKLVSVGPRNNIYAVAEALQASSDKFTNGCWMKVFHTTFGYNGRNPVGVAHISWVDPYGEVRFPMADHRKRFGEIGSSKCDEWLWLVEV